MADPLGDVRCPEGRLFWKIRANGLLEVACRDCRVKLHDPRVAVVLHIYTPTGDLVGTETLRYVSHTEGADTTSS